MCVVDGGCFRVITEKGVCVSVLVEEEGGNIKGEENRGEGGLQLGTGCRDSSGWGTQVGGIYCSLLRCTLLGSTLF